MGGGWQPAVGLLPLGRRRFRSLGVDPQFHLDRPVHGGWYMLELALKLPAARARARLYADFGEGWNEQHAWDLPLRSGRLAKRLVWLPMAARLRLDPLAHPGEFALQRCGLKRVPAHFALDRMRRKLATAIGRAPTALADATTEVLWADYCSLFRPDSTGPVAYEDWIAKVEQPALPTAATREQCLRDWKQLPRFSIVLPVFNPEPRWLAACLDSVRAQHYPHWQLCIADDASTDPEVRTLLARQAAADPRLRIAWRERNGHICAASNDALALADGDFVVLLDHDDVLAPQALFALAEALQRRPSAQILYSDEDKLDADGNRCEPFFKPDWSPDLLRSQNYVCHLGAYRRQLVDQVGGFRLGYEGSQDYDLLLRCAARVADRDDIVHLPQVLYHWRKSAASSAADHDHKPYATAAALRALQDAADAEGRGVQVSVLAPGLYRQLWPLPQPAPLVSLIVPTRDGLDVLRQCIDSILERTRYRPFEVIVVDNQSSQPQTLAYLDELRRRGDADPERRLRVLRYDAPFNYSAINNAAVREAAGEVVGLINNDIEVISPDWLEEMVGHALRPEVGCVGAKLYYPDDTVQHAGVVLGIGGVAGHSHKYFPRSADGYFSRLRVAHNVSAVTGAALLVRKALYQSVGGLDAEHLAVAFNDVDFCLKVRQAGYLNVFTPFAELRHHESRTRGADVTPLQQARFRQEVEAMRRRWGAALDTDPFYSPHLSRSREDYSLQLPFQRPPEPITSTGTSP
ncbi:glycosyltransferase family 2 protein [Aquabacterium sp. J223]|uniref:glycosyltransferase family 2 protein n=1 Tax=Aquabacterium sp. J223 TaxID=2898431 RepID=UPI0021AD879C|nr:glycosyltransferase family 2 protein [Aquabacterium sp. J223]UUX94124.1 glycosyltransferase family 2 protein [Aquabacterium sp. J223]